jgi:flagellar basal body-associated protein FliL
MKDWKRTPAQIAPSCSRMKKEAILIALITVVAVMLLAFAFAVIFHGTLTAYVQVFFMEGTAFVKFLLLHEE